MPAMMVGTNDRQSSPTGMTENAFSCRPADEHVQVADERDGLIGDQR